MFSSPKRCAILCLLLISLSGLYAQPDLKETQVAEGLTAMSNTSADSTTLFTRLEDDILLAALDSLLLAQYPVSKASSDTLACYDSTYVYPSDSTVAYRMALLDSRTPISLTYNKSVQRFIDLYTKNRREQMARMLGEAEYYFPLFEETLDRYDMPLELKYLAIVESALNPSAVSRARARGLWQFMLGTGRLFDLHVDSYVDERHDPVKSTDAACRYLQQLYDMFGDWNLALAAYNSGPGNVRKAIRRSGGRRDFWEISPYLPRETRGYVPAFIAVNYSFAYAGEHKLHAIAPRFRHHEVDTIMVNTPTDFYQLAALLDVPEEELSRLNPHYFRKYVPASSLKDGALPLVLPFEKAGLYVSYQDSIQTLLALEAERKEALGLAAAPAEEQVIHRVRRGESLGLIAERYGVRVSEIMQWNNLHSTLIHTGQRLSIFTKEDNGPKTAKRSSSKKTEVVEAGTEADVYKVQRGDTLYDIARLYPGVTADHIMEWNNIRSARQLQPGMQIKIYKKG